MSDNTDQQAVIECVRCGAQWSGELPMRCPGCERDLVALGAAEEGV